jgi:Helix-turn-helix domain
MAYPLGAVERAMKVRDVILQALAGKLTWIQAAEILGRSARSIRRLRLKFERYGFDELYDCMTGDAGRRRPSGRRWARCNGFWLFTASATRGSTSGTFTRSPGGTIRYGSVTPSSRRPCRAPGSSPNTARAAGIAVAASRDRVSASCFISTAAGTSGWPYSPGSGSPCWPWSMTPPSNCSMPSSARGARASRP